MAEPYKGKRRSGTEKKGPSGYVGRHSKRYFQSQDFLADTEATGFLEALGLADTAA